MDNFLQEKYPAEIIPTSINFRKRIPTGESLDPANCDIKVFDEAGADKTTDMLVAKAVSGTIVSGVIQAGTAATNYWIITTAPTTPTGYKFIGKVFLKVL